jgi:hypothetical protein
VWPGSAQTALLFVGLPLLTGLVLLASPLHDAPPPPLREEAAALTGAAAMEPVAAAPEPRPAAMPRAVAKRAVLDDAVPAVIYELRRSGRVRARDNAAPVAARAEARIAAASLAPQSP